MTVLSGRSVRNKVRFFISKKLHDNFSKRRVHQVHWPKKRQTVLYTNLGREGKMPVIAILTYKNEISIMSMMVKKDDLVDVINYPECTRLVPWVNVVNYPECTRLVPCSNTKLIKAEDEVIRLDKHLISHLEENRGKSLQGLFRALAETVRSKNVR